MIGGLIRIRAVAQRIKAFGLDPERLRRNISRTILKNGSKTMPTQYRRNRAQMAHYLSTEQEIEYRDTLANRETSQGDAQLQSTSTVFAAGTPVEAY